MHYTNEKNIKHKDLSPAQTAALAGKSILYRFFRAVMVTAACIFLVWFILPIFVYGIINPYNIFGILVCSAIILFYSNRIFFIYKKAFLLKKSFKNHLENRKILYICFCCLRNFNKHCYGCLRKYSPC